MRTRKAAGRREADRALGLTARELVTLPPRGRGGRRITIQAKCFILSFRRAGYAAMVGRRSTLPRVARAMQVSYDRHSKSCAGESGRTRLDYRVTSVRRAGRRGASISQQTFAGPIPLHFDSRAPDVGARRRSNSGFASDGRFTIEGSFAVEVNPRRSRAVRPQTPPRASLVFVYNSSARESAATQQSRAAAGGRALPEHAATIR